MASSGADWESILHLAITLARDAGAELQRRFGRQVLVTLKDELNPVTDADQAAETLIRQGIQTYFPSHAIQGEEQGETTPEGLLRWIVDPLDAGALLVACAGGTLSTYDGTPFDGFGHQIVASNGHLHAALLAELAQARRS
jgi:fructose-1,6-bisphosphatase/inositol monophosphatase family enzyme